MVDNEITLTQKIDSSLQVPYQFNSDKITSKKCKLCKHKDREEIEGWFEAQPRRNWTALKTKLSNEKNENISLNAIKNHMLYHFQAAERNSTLSAYGNDLQPWLTAQPNRIASLKMRIAILEREMFTIASEGEDLDIIERRKNAETIKKLADTLLAQESELSKIEETMEPVQVVFNQLKIIVKDEMATIDDVSTKKMLMKVIKRLKDNVGDMMIDSGS